MQSDQYSQLMWENANVTVAPNMAINSNFYVAQNSATLDIGYRDGSSTQLIKSWYWSVDGNLKLPSGGYILNSDDSIYGGSSYSNVEVATYLQVGNIANISVAGNVTATYFVGNGAFLTGIAASSNYSNVQTAAYLATATINTTGNITAGNLFTSGALYVANITTTGASGNISGANYITANYFVGNGALLTGLSSSYSNVQVATYLPTYTGVVTASNVAVNGNVTAQYLFGNGSQLTGIVASGSSYSNVNVAAYLSTATINTTGNITAQNLIGNISITGNITSNVITFNTAAGINVAAGQMAWNSADGTLDIGLSYADVVLQVGQETHYVVRNDTGNIIQNGTAVYCSGVAGGSGRIEASPMMGNIDAVKFLGLSTQDISNGVNGVVTYFGYVRGLDTRGTANTAISVGDETWAVGDQLYVHPTAAGKLTNVEPAAPNVKICVASILIRNQTSGVLFVRPTSNLDMTDLSDVQITSPAVNQFLVYAGNRWENTALDISLDTTPTLGGNLAGAGFNVSNVGNISATGNITAQNFVGNISITGNVTGTSANVTLQAGAYTSVFDNQGNVTVPQLFTAGNIQTAGYLFGNGALLTGIVAGSSYSNVQVATYLPTYSGVVGASNVFVSGNVTAQYFLGNGALLTGIASSYSNVQVATYLPTYTGNVANVRLGTSGILTFPDGTQQTTAAFGGGGNYGNANVAAFLPTYTGTTGITQIGTLATLSVTGNATVGNLVGTEANTRIIANTYVTTFDIYGNVSFPANVIATNFVGSGSLLSGVVTKITGSWTVPTGNSTQSFTVPLSGTYQLWVDCNIPNGILAWNATATVTNNNVPVVGAQYAWVYSGGGTPVDFTSIPNQFVGTGNTIVRSSVSPSVTTNRFDFGINNTSGGNITVRYGYVSIS
jgi:hypothetical protein